MTLHSAEEACPARERVIKSRRFHPDKRLIIKTNEKQGRKAADGVGQNTLTREFLPKICGVMVRTLGITECLGT